jgi:hypothetical protein
MSRGLGVMQRQILAAVEQCVTEQVATYTARDARTSQDWGFGREWYVDEANRWYHHTTVVPINRIRARMPGYVDIRGPFLRTFPRNMQPTRPMLSSAFVASFSRAIRTLIVQQMLVAITREHFYSAPHRWRNGCPLARCGQHTNVEWVAMPKC